MNIPNILTFIRLLLVPVFIISFFSSIKEKLIISVLVFIIAGITDILDGYIARRFNMITKWGQVLDPLADKIMQLTVLTCFTTAGFIPIWFVIIYGIKELSMIFGGIFLFVKKENFVIPANFFGKLATFLFYVAVIAVAFEFKYNLHLFGLAVLCALIAFFQYSVLGSLKLKQIKNSDK